MPDVFDAIQPERKPDIFDQVAGGGDIFDQIAPGFMEKARTFLPDYPSTGPTPDYLKMISGGISKAYESKPAQDLMTTLQVAGEVPVAAATGVAGFFAGKAGGLAQTILGRPEEVARETEERIARAVSIQPKTELGQKIIETLFAPFTALYGFGEEALRLPAESWKIPEEAMYPVETLGGLITFAALPFTAKLIKQSRTTGKVTPALVEIAKKEIIKEQEVIIKIKETADKVRETKPEVADKIVEKLEPRIENLEKAKESLVKTGEKLSETIEFGKPEVKVVEPAKADIFDEIAPPAAPSNKIITTVNDIPYSEKPILAIKTGDKVIYDENAGIHPDIPLTKTEHYEVVMANTDPAGWLYKGKFYNRKELTEIMETEKKLPSTETVPSAPITAKQPWEMTREEILAVKGDPLAKTLEEKLQNVRELLSMRDRGAAPAKKAIIKGKKEQIAGIERQIAERESKHKLSIEQALAEGKPVPPEVLKDYPELKGAPAAMVKDYLGKLQKKLALEAQGEGVLDSIEAAGKSPIDVSKNFWDRTYWKLTAAEQTLFKKQLENHTGTGKKDIQELLKDQDLPDKVEYLEGTDRGYVSLMEYMNQKKGVQPPAPAGKQPLRYDPTVNRHNGEKLIPGDILKDIEGNTYRLDRDSGFILTVDQINKTGEPIGIKSFSVDPADKTRFKDLYRTGENAFDSMANITGVKPEVLKDYPELKGAEVIPLKAEVPGVAAARTKTPLQGMYEDLTTWIEAFDRKEKIGIKGGVEDWIAEQTGRTKAEWKKHERGPGATKIKGTSLEELSQKGKFGDTEDAKYLRQELIEITRLRQGKPAVKTAEIPGMEKKTISQFTEEYKEGLGEEGAIKIGGVEVKPKVVVPGTKDVALPEFGLGALHVADRHPVIAPIIKANIKAEQNTNHWISRYSDRISDAFDKVEKPGIWMNVFGRKGTDIRDIDLMSEGKKPVPTPLTGFVTEVKGILGDVKGEIIQKMKNDFRKSLSSAQQKYSLWVEGGKIGEEPKMIVAEHSYEKTYKVGDRIFNRIIKEEKTVTITVPEHTRPFPESTKKAVDEAQTQFKEMEKWGFIDYFPHIFKGRYKYLTEEGHIIASGQTAKQAKANFEEYVESHPETSGNTFMFVNDFYDLLTVRKVLNPELTSPLEYLGTRLSRKEFFRLLSNTEKVIKEEIAAAGVADIPKVKVDMSGIASFQKGTKFSGHFLKRKTSLRGEEADPYRALMSYIFSVGRKLGLEDAKMASYTFADSLPANMPNAKSYIKMQADNMSGRYNIIDKVFDETIGEKLGAKPFGVTRLAAKGVGLESKLKLGYAPAKTAINRMGGQLHTLLQEGARNYFEGKKLLKMKDPELMGRIEREGHLAGMEQLFAGEGLLGVAPKELSRWRPLGAYQRAEVKNRSEALASAYSAGLKKFGGDKDAAWIYAIDSARLTQGLYNTAAKPVLVRGPVLQASYQFKQYLTNEIRFMSQLTPAQWAGYIPGIVALSGTRGALLTIKSIIGIGVIGVGIDELMERLNRKAPHLHRGVFGLLGFDVSAPASWQIPSSVKDWIGVLPRDIMETGEMAIKGLQNNGWTDEEINDYVRQLWPVGYNVFKGLQILSEGVTKEGTKVIYKGDKVEGVINLMGARTVKQSQASDSARYMNQQRRLLLGKIKVAEDKLFRAKGTENIDSAFKELVELKNPQTPEEMNTLISGLQQSAKSRLLTEEQRIFLTLPKSLKREEALKR